MFCGSILPRSNLFRPEPAMITRPLADSRARRRGRRPRALPLSMLCFLAGEVFGKGMERQGSGNGSNLPGLTAHMGRNEPFNANPLWSRCCLVRSVACPLARRFTPRHPPRGCFRYGYERLDSSVPPYPRTPSPPVGSSGRLLFGERKESSPQLGLLLVPSESTLRTTPLLVFISVCGGVASASSSPDFDEGRRSSFAIGRS